MHIDFFHGGVKGNFLGSLVQMPISQKGLNLKFFKKYIIFIELSSTYLEKIRITFGLVSEL